MKPCNITRIIYRQIEIYLEIGIVAAGVVPDNEASKKILERLGFVLMGTDDDERLIYEYVVQSEHK